MGLQVRLPSFSAQALATAEFGALLPGMVAQPPFSMRARRSQEETLLNATSLAAASVCCWNFSTQIGVSAATTAVSARWFAIFSAVLPSVHPSDENPTTVNATTPTTAPHTAGFTPGWTFISSPSLWEKGISPCCNHRVISAWRARDGRLGNYSDDARPVFAVGLSPMIAYWAAGLIGECSGATQSAMPTNSRCAALVGARNSSSECTSASCLRRTSSRIRCRRFSCSSEGR